MSNRMWFGLKADTFWLMVRYGIVGVIASVLHFSISYFCVKAWNFDPMLAHFIGFLFGLVTAYSGHYFYSFKDDGEHRHRFPKFVVTALTALVLHKTGVFVLVKVYQFDYITLVLPLLLVSVPLVTFLMSKFWVFSDSK